MRTMRFFLKIQMICGFFVLSSCSNHSDTETASISTETLSFVDSYNLNIPQILGTKVMPLSKSMVRTRASQGDEDEYDVIFPSDTEPQIKDLIYDVETVQDLAEFMSLTNAYLEKDSDDPDAFHIDVSSNNLRQVLSPLVSSAKDYLMGLGLDESDIQEMLAENNADESYLIPFAVALTGFEYAKSEEEEYAKNEFKISDFFATRAYAAGNSPYLDCALEALGISAISLSATSTLKTWGKAAMKKAFAGIAKRLLGPLGAAIFMIEYGLCISRTHNSTCTYAVTYTPSQITEKYEKLKEELNSGTESEEEAKP